MSIYEYAIFVYAFFYSTLKTPHLLHFQVYKHSFTFCRKPQPSLQQLINMQKQILQEHKCWAVDGERSIKTPVAALRRMHHEKKGSSI